jgi:hypothetical protein
VDKGVRAKVDRLGGANFEQHSRFFIWVRYAGRQEGEIAVRRLTMDDPGSWADGDSEALSTDRDAASGTNLERGA